MTNTEGLLEAPVVSAAQLAAALDDPSSRESVVVIDCRFSLADPGLGRRQYLEEHIAGAHYLDLEQDLSAPVGEYGGRHPLPSPTALAKTLAALGVNSGGGELEQTWVVAYDDSRQAFASRLWWLLRYLGHQRVAVLDGGYRAWRAQGALVDSGQAPNQALDPVTPGHFVARPQPQMVVDIEQVRRRSATSVLVDAREEERFLGIREPIDPVAGHILGAVNYPWPEATNEQGFLLSPAMHRQRWENIGEAEQLILYCGSGVTACVDLLSLSLAGFDQGQLYVGSWSDWCSYHPDQ